MGVHVALRSLSHPKRRSDRKQGQRAPTYPFPTPLPPTPTTTLTPKPILTARSQTRSVGQMNSSISERPALYPSPSPNPTLALTLTLTLTLTLALTQIKDQVSDRFLVVPARAIPLRFRPLSLQCRSPQLWLLSTWAGSLCELGVGVGVGAHRGMGRGRWVGVGVRVGVGVGIGCLVTDSDAQPPVALSRGQRPRPHPLGCAPLPADLRSSFYIISARAYLQER